MAAPEAVEQLGTMSLEISVEEKDTDTEPTSKFFCSACEKKGDILKKCSGCKCVWYCDKKCQNQHRKEHRKDCKRIKKELDKRGGKLDFGMELDVGPLPSLSPKKECPICMHALPITERLYLYAVCCGQTICGGCSLQHQLKCEEARSCPFCRTSLPKSKSEKEYWMQLRKRVELKDPNALHKMAMDYGYGQNGISTNPAKCIELLVESAGLGFPSALHQLGIYHDCGWMGLEQNKEEAFKHYKAAAERGHLISRHNLGCTEDENENYAVSMRHLRLSASGGYRKSLEFLMIRFEGGLLHHADLAETLPAFYHSRAEM